MIKKFTLAIFKIYSLLKRRYLDYIIPIFTCLILTVMVIFLYTNSIKKHHSVLRNKVNDTGQLLSRELKNIVQLDISRLKNLKYRLEESNGEYFDNWETDANFLIQQNPSMQFVEWIDSSMIIRKIVPLKGNEAAINLDISKIDYRYPAWIAHGQSGTINMTSWVELTQEGHSFLIDVPVYIKDKFYGTITAGMNFQDSFERIITYLENEYSIAIYDDKNKLFYSANQDPNFLEAKRFELSNTLKVLDEGKKEWRVNIAPSKKLLLAESNVIANIAFVVGLLLSLITSFLIHFYLRTKQSAILLSKSNLALTNANETLNIERNKAENASRAKTDFLSNMSHEIRTPLHAIVGFIELLKESKLSQTDKEYLSLMETSSNNLMNTINDILDFEKIESGKIELAKVQFNPMSKIKELLEINQLIYSQKNLYLKGEFGPTANVMVLGDESKLLQITNNIIKNGLKFTRKGGVTLTYSDCINEKGNLRIDISIMDTGIGIPENKLETIFDRFTQIENSIKKQYEGSGLGLAISRIFIKMMGGEIAVKSKENVGTEFVFHVTLPIAEGQANQKTEAFEKNIDFSNLSTLIVDDNKVNILVLKKFLQDMGITPDTANDGKVALDMVGHKQYDLIFMDVHMPEMDGWEATQEIRKINKEVVIFGISANVTADAINNSIDTGMNNYLTKPFKKKHLHKLLHYHFDNHKVL